MPPGARSPARSSALIGRRTNNIFGPTPSRNRSRRTSRDRACWTGYRHQEGAIFFIEPVAAAGSAIVLASSLDGHAFGSVLASLCSGKRRADDAERLVVVVDCVHVHLPAATPWLRLGLPRLGASVSEIHPATPRTSCGRWWQPPIRSSCMGRGRRLHVDSSPHRLVLGSFRVLVALNCRGCR